MNVLFIHQNFPGQFKHLAPALAAEPGNRVLALTLREKLRIAKALADLKVDVIEAGFPAASPGDFDSVKAIADENRGPTICGLARCNPEYIQKVHAAVKGADNHRIHVFVTTSTLQRQPHRRWRQDRSCFR